MDEPARVGSVTLLEPAARGISSLEQVVAALGPVVGAYRSGDSVGAVDGFLRRVCGEGYRAELGRVLPDAFDEALREADLFFQAEMPAVQQFRFGPDDARRVKQPVLNVVVGVTEPRFVEGFELVQSWSPQAEQFTVRGAGHLLMVQNPVALGEALAQFFGRHPLRHG
jgi:pimeloyl-ACP methyl ester carboxylesterase